MSNTSGPGTFVGTETIGQELNIVPGSSLQNVANVPETQKRFLEKVLEWKKAFVPPLPSLLLHQGLFCI